MNVVTSVMILLLLCIISNSRSAYGFEEILVTSTYQRNDISLYTSLQEGMIEILLEVHLDKYSFFVLGLFRGISNCPYDTALSDRMVNERELMWK